jgi:hypothetical protein
MKIAPDPRLTRFLLSPPIASLIGKVTLTAGAERFGQGS